MDTSKNKFARGVEIATNLSIILLALIGATVLSGTTCLGHQRHPVTNVAPAAGIYNTTNASMAFGLTSTADMAVVFMSSETQLTVTAMGVNPATAANALRWRVDRDPTDSIDSGTRHGGENF